jgi:hypothetical protein
LLGRRNVARQLVKGRMVYTSAEFAAALQGLDLRLSVGRTGICYDCEHPAVVAAAV